MAEESTDTNPPVTESQKPSVEPTQTQSNPTPTTNQSHNSESPLKTLQDALDALPEKVASAVREAMPKPPRQSAPKTESGNSANSSSQPAANTQTQTSPTDAKPGKKSFHDWWFGK